MNPFGTMIIGALSLCLAGCGSPSSLHARLAAPEPEAVADAGHGGRKTATLDLTQAFSAQARVHKWVARDIVHVHATLAEVSAGSAAAVAGDPSYRARGFSDAKQGGLFVTLTSTQGRARFKGLEAGKRYAAFLVVEGRKFGTQDPLTILNQQQGYMVKNQEIDFTGSNDVDDHQTITATLQLDDVAFDGTGIVVIGGVVNGSYSNATGPVTGAPDSWGAR